MILLQCLETVRPALMLPGVPTQSFILRGVSPKVREHGHTTPVAYELASDTRDRLGVVTLITFTDQLGSDIRLIPTTTTLTAEHFAELFFQHWYCENGLPLEIISDRDKLFLSRFWKELHKLTGIKLKMSTAYHPESDGSSERTNKTVIQAIRFAVERDQKGCSVRSLRGSHW